MPDYELLFPGRFIKSVEFKGKDVTLTMTGVETEELPQDKGGNKLRGIIAFKETKKKLVLNRTNAECLVAMFGRDYDKWNGHRVTFYPAPYEGETCIRVKGSPELKDVLEAEIKLPRKRPFKMRLIPTGKGASAPAPEPPPDFDREESLRLDSELA